MHTCNDELLLTTRFITNEIFSVVCTVKVCIPYAKSIGNLKSAVSKTLKLKKSKLEKGWTIRFCIMRFSCSQCIYEQYSDRRSHEHNNIAHYTSWHGLTF